MKEIELRPIGRALGGEEIPPREQRRFESYTCIPRVRVMGESISQDMAYGGGVTQRAYGRVHYSPITVNLNLSVDSHKELEHLQAFMREHWACSVQLKGSGE